jgi:hypothetical protein
MSTAPAPSPPPAVGDLTLDYETLDLPADPGQKLIVYSAEPATPAQQALDLLATTASKPSESPPVDKLRNP